MLRPFIRLKTFFGNLSLLRTPPVFGEHSGFCFFLEPRTSSANFMKKQSFSELRKCLLRAESCRGIEAGGKVGRGRFFDHFRATLYLSKCILSGFSLQMYSYLAVFCPPPSSILYCPQIGPIEVRGRFKKMVVFGCYFYAQRPSVCLSSHTPLGPNAFSFPPCHQPQKLLPEEVPIGLEAHLKPALHRPLGAS